MKNEGTPIIKSFSEWVSSGNSPTFTSPLTLDQIDDAALSSSSFLSNASDISTRIFAHELIPDFLKTLSEKYIGDVARWVHQSGRYYDGYSQVRLDTMPELIQQRDAISSRMLREVNDSLEVIVNNYIE